MDINAFITENSVILIVIGIFIVLTIVGYVAKKTEFGQKVSAKNKEKEKNNIPTDEVKIEILDDNANSLFEENDNKIEEPIEQLDILDTIEPNFNNGNLIIGDVNENPVVSNEELGIQEDLYAPFGDQELSTDKLPELKIEEVTEDNFSILEKNKSESLEINDSEILEPLNYTEDVSFVPELKIEDVGETLDLFETQKQNDVLVDTISDIVDNTFVINDATDDFGIHNSENKITDNDDETEQDVNVVSSDEESKIKQFKIEEDEFNINEQPDYDLEATTNLKLDEINEKIKNLKLEDLENSNFEEEIEVPKKKNKKSKKVSVKSVDDIKKEKNIATDSQNINSEINQILDFPNLDEIVQNEQKNEEVTETDDIWNF